MYVNDFCAFFAAAAAAAASTASAASQCHFWETQELPDRVRRGRNNG